jgi:hypothetical protein
MAADTTHTPAPTVGSAHVLATTRRGIATASVSLGMWGLLVFWWYPFGMMIAGVGLTLGLISIALGIRAGKDGEHLAYVGSALGFLGVNFAVVSYRVLQTIFEGAPTLPAFLVWPF